MSISPEEIKNIRESLGRTQGGMADIVETTQVTWSRWENGKASPHPIYVTKLLKLKAIVARQKEAQSHGHE